jgi:hypothetical protein
VGCSLGGLRHDIGKLLILKLAHEEQHNEAHPADVIGAT